MRRNGFLRKKDDTWFEPEIGNLLTGMIEENLLLFVSFMWKEMNFLRVNKDTWFVPENWEIGNLTEWWRKIVLFVKFM